MGLFDMFVGPDINEGIKTFQQTKGAMLIDVRERDEYGRGHIPQSVNVPLSTLELISTTAPNKDTPLFLYCRSGNRSKRAAAILRQSGYTNVSNIGGIMAYQGKIER